jgi:hypothetical protein
MSSRPVSFPCSSPFEAHHKQPPSPIDFFDRHHRRSVGPHREFGRAIDVVPSPRWEPSPRSRLPTSSIELGPYLTLAEPHAYLGATLTTVQTPSIVDRRHAEVSLPPHCRATSSVSPHPGSLPSASVAPRRCSPRPSFSTLATGLTVGTAPPRHTCVRWPRESARSAPWVSRPLGCRPVGPLWRLDQANSTEPSRPRRFSRRPGSVRVVVPRRIVALGQNHDPVPGFVFLFISI